MRTYDILNYSLNHIMSMSKHDLELAVRQLSMESNKRLAAFKRNKVSSPAVTYIMKHGGKFSSKNKNIYELREEFQRAKGFLETETGTIRGFRGWENKVANTLEQSTGIKYNELTEKQKSLFWQAYARLEELDQANVYGARYRTSVNEIYTAVKGGLKKKDLENFVTKLSGEIYTEDTAGFLTGENNPFEL